MAFASTIDRWFGMKSRLSGSSRRAAARRRRAAPLLESFEDRVMLTSMTLQVNTTNDLHLGTLLPGYGWDSKNDGEISLRSALEAVNYYGATNHGTLDSITIDVPAGNYYLSLGELDLIPNGIAVTIAGEGSLATAISAQQQSRVLEIQAGSAPASITLQDLVLELGLAHDSGAIGSSQAAGGGILDNSNPLTLQNVNLAGNGAVATSSSMVAAGGAIYAVGAPVSITNSTIVDSTVTGGSGAQGLGGGVYESGGSLTIVGSTVEYNTVQSGALAAGGGIATSASNVSITGSTVTFNSAIGNAGGPNARGGSAEGGGLYFDDPSIGPFHSLTIGDSHFDNNQVTGGASGRSYGTSYVLNSTPLGAGDVGEAGGQANGGGIFVNSYTGTTAVAISGSSVNSNTATGGAGGAGAAGGAGVGPTGNIPQAPGGAGGAGGYVHGAGLDVAVPNGSVQISGSTLSNNLATGGAGGTGGMGGNAGSIQLTGGFSVAGVNGWVGGEGGEGGWVQGAGASLTAQTTAVTTTAFEGNSALGGLGGTGGPGGAPSQHASGGAGGAGGGGGNVLGAGLLARNDSGNVTTATLSAVTIQDNLSTGGAGGAGSYGSPGANNDQSAALSIFDIISYIPEVGLIGDIGTLIINADRLGTTTAGSAGGDGGSGGLGGTVTAALAIGGSQVSIEGSALLQNAGQAGVGGPGGNGGDGGDNDTGPGGAAGNAGPAGMGGLAFGGGLDALVGNVTVANSTIDGNTISAAPGGAFGVSGIPGPEQPVSVSDIFYPALGIAVNIVAGIAEVNEVEGISETYDVAQAGGGYAEFLSTGSDNFPQFLALTPSITGADGQTASAATSGIAAGGGVYAADSTLNLINDTITRNTSDLAGGVYAATTSTVSIGNTVVAEDTARRAAPDILGAIATNAVGVVVQRSTLTSLGHNVIGILTPNVTGFDQPGDISGTVGAPFDPGLGPLQLNGGATLNREPMAGDLLVGGGSAALVTQYGLTTDQTGVSRSVYGTVDIGADEAETGLEGATLTVNSTDGTETPTNVLTLAEAVALTNGSLAYSQLTPQQQAQVTLGTGSGPDTIQFASALAGQTISLSTAQASAFGPTALAIDAPVTIVGPTGGVTIGRDPSAGNLRLFEVAASGRLTLENLTLSQGLAIGATGATGINGGGGGGGGAGMGGAVLNFGTLTIQDSTLSGNGAQGGAGGPNGAPLPGQYLAFQTGAPGGGPVPGLAGQAGGFASGGGGASFAGYGGAGGLGGGGGANANKLLGGVGFTGPGAGGLGGGGSSNGGVRVGAGGGGGLGGAIFNAGTVTITGSTLTGNSATGGAGSGNGGIGSGLGGAVFNDNGTVTVSGTSFSGNTANQGAGIANVGDGRSDPIPVQTATLTLTGTTLADTTNSATDVQEITINGGTATDSGSSNLILGIPAAATPAGTAIALSAGATSASSTPGNPGSNDLWQVSDRTGQAVVAAQNLTFNPNPGPVPLPVSLIQNSGTITVDVTFQTTTGGVILGYQDQPLGTTPGNFVPALYVGTNGLLYAEISTAAPPGSVAPIHSAVAVNDGREHHAVLTVAKSPVSGVAETLTLDGVNVGFLTGTLQPLNMAFDQLGTGDTANWPGGNGGIDPFRGTIDQINITDDAGIPYSAQQLSFTPTDPVSLPNGLISGATALTTDLTFQTTAGGVILGTQDQPVGAVPTQSIPILYVGTDGLLHAEALDGSGKQLVSAATVNDGKTHQVVLTETAGNETLTLDGAAVGTLTGLSNPLGLVFDQLGTGYTSGLTAAPNGFDPFTGTIDQVVISGGALSASSVTFPAGSTNQVTFTPPAGGTYAVGLQVTDSAGDLGTASQPSSVTGAAPAPSIGGLPGAGAVGTPIVLTASATDPSPANQVAGFNYLWEAGLNSGQTAMAGQGLNFTGGNPLTLPNGLISGASSLTVDVRFNTTSDGVILGYQNTPTGSTPTQYMPALYVGTDGRLYAEIDDGTSREMVSSTKVNDGQVHHAVLTETGSAQSLTLDGTTIATLSGTPNPLSMTFDQLGTGYAVGHPNTPDGYFPFTGTIDSVEIDTGTAATSPFTFAGTGDSQATFMPPDIGTYTIGLLASDQQGFTGSTSQPLVVDIVPPTPAIVGLPSGSSSDGTPITLTASVTDPSPSVTAAGFNDVWSVSAGTGQDVVVGQNLTFNRSNPVNLPSGLILNASTLTVDLTFQTTSDGVILGYQNQPIGATPNAYMPALYVGTDGKLYAEIYDGSFRQMVSGTTVNDGQVHHAVLTETGSAQSLTLDGTTIATLSGTPSPLNMTFDQLGTGFTTYYAAAANGYFPFTGTINSLTITAGTTLAGSVVLSGSSGNPMTFTPRPPGVDTIALTVTDEFGNTGSASGTVNAIHVNPVAINLPTTTVQAVQGQPFSLSGTVTDTTSFATNDLNAQFGDGIGSRLGGSHVTSFTVSHAYANAGDYTVTMNYSDSLGNTAHATFQVIVSGFTVNDGSPHPAAVAHLTYTFADPVTIKPGAFKLLRNGRPSHVRLVLDEQPDEQDFLITFRGPGVVAGTLPDGSYTLITQRKKVHALSGPPMTRNDVNKFVSHLADVPGGKHHVRTPGKGSRGKMGPPRPRQAKFPGRTVHHHAAGRTALSLQRPAHSPAVGAVDRATAVAIGLPAQGKQHPR